MDKFAVGKPPRVRRPPVSYAGREFFKHCGSFGTVPIKRGWPDYHIVTRSGRFICVEVKSSDYQGLKFDQNAVLLQFAKHGIDSYVWTPKGGFFRIHPDGHTTSEYPKDVYA